MAIVFAIATLILTTLGGWYLYVSNANTIKSTIKANLNARIAILESQTSQFIFPQTATALKAKLNSDPEFLQIYNAKFQLLYSTIEAGSSSQLSKSQLSKVDASPTYLLLGQRSDGKRYLAQAIQYERTKQIFLIGLGTDQLTDSEGTIFSRIIFGIPLLVLLAAFGGFWLATRALKPVERLRLEAERLRNEGSTKSLAIPATKDELSSLAITLNHFLSDVGESIERQKVFVASASHELRTPLSRIMADLELALTPNRDPKEVTRLIAHTSNSIMNLNLLCNSLLMLANGERHEIELQKRLLPIGDVIIESITPYQSAALEKEVLLVLDLDEQIRVEVDPAHFGRVIENMMENALRFAPHDSVITISSAITNDQISISISDMGPGFPPEFISEAFKPFSRAVSKDYNTRGVNTAGLGLSIAEMIVKLHNGSIVASNQLSGGAVLTIYLPYGNKKM
ncbi:MULTISPECIES: HAMP domain-containing sensor histidine kinase [Acidithrix]|uniref:histidine kinase n=1 Tax=Acidithrix ferrooxidans TaxID=1280514 RepID=A0A0D8HG70_9ACTN|nr:MULTISPECIES: HAMP domain-containing sensor histidine kinase [Acidithrix]KJF16918.1 signal transduction histidine-protein kinase ArlS [Acidithrix ferrooxidans]CAG4903838.1 unnamed protein product [Acidithrix sp. C25]